MAWLSGLADKAETLLNKIDQNTAAVLNSDKNEYDQKSQMFDAKISSHPEDFVDLEKLTDFSKRPFRSLRSDLNVGSPFLSLSKIAKQEGESKTYPNTPRTSPARKTTNRVAMVQLASSLPIVEVSTENSNFVPATQSERTSLEPHRIVLDISENDSMLNDERINDVDLPIDDTSFRWKVEEPDGVSFVPTNLVEKSIEHDVTANFREKLEYLRREYEYRLKQKQLEIERLAEKTRSNDDDAKNSLRAAKRNFLDKTEVMNKQRIDYEKELDVMREKLKLLENESMENLQKFHEAQTALERCRSELGATRTDLEQHRARALKTLQEKEKLIAELKNNSRVGPDDDATIMELNQLRQEREILREECQQIHEQLRLSREELMIIDLKMEESSRRAIESNREAHETLSAERRRRIEAEEDARVHAEEVRNLRNELEIQLDNWSTKFRKNEAEITRLRSQLSAASTPSSAIESRLASLTQTLVTKQQALESLTTEKNALRLQLERMEQEYCNVVANSRKNGYSGVNDNIDDDKAEVPRFLVESPFDTGVARRVKRAYSTLDAISIRTGVFLRRYPLARIFVLLYMALLQFWVIVVLFSQSPEAH